MKYIILVMLLLTTFFLKAQDIRLAGVEYFHYPKARLKDGASDVQASFHEYGAFANYPWVSKNKKTIIVNGFTYGFVQATSHVASMKLKSTAEFHKIAYNFMIIYRWKETWAVIARISPTLASDFAAKFNKNDFMMQASLTITKRINDYSNMSGGIVYTTRLGKPLLLPTFQYSYSRNKHSFTAIFPALINYAYKADKKERLLAGGRIGLNGANFNATINNFSSNIEVQRLNYFRANLGPFVNYKITKMLQVEVFSGLSAMRQYQFEDALGNRYKYNSNSGFFLNIGLALVVPQSKKTPNGAETKK